ncbi:MAG: membrane dipeptidase [Armatimonadetes bacterium]|nr:membrane dipeptidase [Armatimonadota bacterium]
MILDIPVVNMYGGPAWMDVSVRRRFYGERAVFTHRHLPDVRRGGVEAIVQPLGEFERLEEILAEVAESDGHLALARNADDVRASAAAGRVALILCAGDRTLDGSLDRLYLLRHIGIRVLSLTHNRRNLISDGCGDRTGAGLSHFGVDVVRRCGSLGIVIDVSHISEAGFWDVIEQRTGPVIATHSNARALCDHPRNLTNEQLRALAQLGGVAGLNFYPGFVKADAPTIEDLLNHVEYIADLVGVDHAGLGPDYVNMLPEAMYETTLARTDPTGAMYAGSHAYPRGAEDMSSFSAVGDGLRRRGWGERDIARTMGGNFLRVLETAGP